MFEQKKHISVEYSEDSLIITLNEQANIYQTVLQQISDQPGLSQWFDSLKDLGQHLQNQQNYKINREAKIIEIKGKHPTKPNAYIQIAKLKLMSVKNKQELKPSSIEQILTICSSPQEITNNQLKNAVKILAFQIKKLIKQGCNPIQKAQNNETKSSQEMFEQMIKNKKEQLNQYIEQEGQNLIEKARQESKILLKKTGSSLTSLDNEQIKQNYKSSIIMEIQKSRKQQDEVFDVFINKMNTNFQSTDLRLEKIQDRIVEIEQKFLQISNKIGLLEKIDAGENYIDHACFGYKTILVEGKSIKKIKGEEADIFFKTKIKDKNKFSILIKQLTGFICVGVAGADLKMRQTFINQPNCVTLYNDGNFYNGVSMRGKICLGYAKGDIIQVIVSLEAGKIEWFVNNQLRLSYNYERLKNEIEWVPYVWISQNGTSFSIIE